MKPIQWYAGLGLIVFGIVVHAVVTARAERFQCSSPAEGMALCVDGWTGRAEFVGPGGGQLVTIRWTFGSDTPAVRRAAPVGDASPADSNSDPLNKYRP